MARQKGPLKLKGAIGDLSFYKSQDGYMLREKGGVSKQRIMNDPAFQRTRENGREFGSAGASGRLLREAFAGVLGRSADRRMGSRLHKLLVSVLRTDPVNGRGSRLVVNGDLSKLQGFNFNKRSTLSTTLTERVGSEVDRVTGEMKLILPEFVPKIHLKAPPGASHYQISFAAAEIDFDTDIFDTKLQRTAVKEISFDEEAAETLTVQLTPATILPVFLMIKVEFFTTDDSGSTYPLYNGTYCPALLINVDAD